LKPGSKKVGGGKKDEKNEKPLGTARKLGRKTKQRTGHDSRRSRRNRKEKPTENEGAEGNSFRRKKRAGKKEGNRCTGH